MKFLIVLFLLCGVLSTGLQSWAQNEAQSEAQNEAQNEPQSEAQPHNLPSPPEPFEYEMGDDSPDLSASQKKAKTMLQLYLPVLDGLNDITLVTSSVCTRFINTAVQIRQRDTDMLPVFESCTAAFSPCSPTERLITVKCIASALNKRAQHWKEQAYVPPRNIDPLFNALINSLIYGDTKSARILIQNGVDPYATTRKKQTALMAAAYYGHEQIFDLLLQEQLEALGYPDFDQWLDQKDIYGHNILMYLGRQNSYRSPDSSVTMLQQLFSYIKPKVPPYNLISYAVETNSFLASWLSADNPLDLNISGRYATEMIRLTKYPSRKQSGYINPLEVFYKHFNSSLTEQQMAFEAVLNKITGHPSIGAYDFNNASYVLRKSLSARNVALVRYLLKTRSFNKYALASILSEARYAVAHGSSKSKKLRALQNLQAVLQIVPTKLTESEASDFYAERIEQFHESSRYCCGYDVVHTLISSTPPLPQSEIRKALQERDSRAPCSNSGTSGTRKALLQAAECSLWERLPFGLCSSF